MKLYVVVARENEIEGPSVMLESAWLRIEVAELRAKDLNAAMEKKHAAWLQRCQIKWEPFNETHWRYDVEDVELSGVPPGVVREMPQIIEREAVVRRVRQEIIDAMDEVEQDREEEALTAALGALEDVGSRLGIDFKSV